MSIPGMEVGYSPWAPAEDLNDHILRSKLSTGMATGEAHLANPSAHWDILDSDFFQLTDGYMKIRTKGIQRYYYYGRPFAGQSGDVNDKLTSSQFPVFLLFIHRI